LEEGYIEQQIEALRNGRIEDERFLVRLLENLSWHSLVKIIPKERLLKFINHRILSQIRSKRRRENLENVKSILLDLPLPFSRWDNITAERARHGFLSNRWYGIK